VRPLTLTELGGTAGLYIDEVWTWIDSRGQKSFTATRTRCRVARLSRNQSPDAERAFMYPVIALIVLTLFTWIVEMGASCDG
jgi:hypothetical protein